MKYGSTIGRIAPILLCAAWIGSAAEAEPATLTIDPAKTTVHFVLQATGHKVEGTIEVESGEIEFDLETGRASGELRLDLSSAATGNDGRDEKMHDDVFETAKFPDLVFHAERIDGKLTPESAGEIELGGRLEIHGASHPLALRAEVWLRGETLQGRTSFQVPYVEWGLKDPSVFVLRVAKEVAIEVELAGSIEPVAVEPAREDPG